MQGMPEANCMGETALHLYSCRGDIVAVQKLLPLMQNTLFVHGLVHV
jgi:hypothetical protein